MNSVFRTLMLFALLPLGCSIGIAQGYRNIVPLRSGCADVKRILRVARCDYPTSKYEFEDETLRVTFSTMRCDKAWGRAWNVPRGTVLGIERIFRKPVLLSDSDIDLSKYKEAGRASDIDEAYYLNEDDGTSLLVVENGIRSIDYSPTGTSKRLLCRASRNSATNKSKFVPLSNWFDRYGHLPFSKEKKRLDILAKELDERPQTSQVIIVVYNDRKLSNRNALARAGRARKYLTLNFGIDLNRIKIISGGKSEAYATLIYIVPSDQLYKFPLASKD